MQAMGLRSAGSEFSLCLKSKAKEKKKKKKKRKKEDKINKLS